MIKGSLHFTSDHNMLFDFIRQDPQNNVVIAISQNIDQNLVSQTGALVASVLTPSYDCFMKETNGDMEGFCAAYYDQLYRKECMEYIACILKALTIGKHVMLYATPDEAETNYVYTFSAFLAQTFGIICGNSVIPFSYSSDFYLTIAVTLYLADLYTSQELFEIWKNFSMLRLPESVIVKLVNEYKPVVPQGQYDINKYHDLFLQLAVGFNGKQLIVPAKFA